MYSYQSSMEFEECREVGLEDLKRTTRTGIVLEIAAA